MNYILIHIVLIVLLLVLSAFFSGSETALFSIKKAELHRFIESKREVERSIASLMKNPEKILITLLLGNLFVNLTLTALTTNFMLKYFGRYGHFITIGLVTPLIIILSEISPKIVALKSYNTLSRSLLPYISFFHMLITPVRYCILFYTDVLIKGLKLKLDHSSLTEEELRHVFLSGEKQGLIDKHESEILKNVLRFTKKEASNVMYPRNQAIFIEYGSSINDAMSLILENDIVRVPVFKNDADNIVGVVDSRDMLSCYLAGKGRTINRFIRAIDFFPFSKDLNELLNDFLEKKIQIAVVVDEYGGTAGIVTLNAILSALLGKDFGKWENFKKDMVRESGDGGYIVYGEMQLDEFNAYFNLDVSSNKSDTIGGYVTEELTSIPSKGDTLVINDLELTIKSVIKRTVKSIHIKRKGSSG